VFCCISITGGINRTAALALLGVEQEQAAGGYNSICTAYYCNKIGRDIQVCLISGLCLAAGYAIFVTHAHVLDPTASSVVSVLLPFSCCNPRGKRYLCQFCASCGCGVWHLRYPVLQMISSVSAAARQCHPAQGVV
jgi:hypothetical protein